MPESVRNRCTKAHEYIFLLVKKSGYYYDAEDIRVPLKMSDEEYLKMLKNRQGKKVTEIGTSQEVGAGSKTGGFNAHIASKPIYVPSGANRRSVWTIDDERALLDWMAENNPEMLQQFAEQSKNRLDVFRISSESYPGAHFATFPRKLITPCILAGTSEKGCCEKCGAPWKRVVERDRQPTRPGINNTSDVTGMANRDELRHVTETKTTGWEPGCECNAGVVPCVVLDPFVGSGTSCCVSLAHGRRSIGIDLSEKYLRDNAVPRIEGELLSRPTLAGLAGKVTKAIELGDEI